jgi:phosphonate transport system substrate-binding protein
MRDDILLIGAVAYDPKVVSIWEGFKWHFASCGLDVDHVLFSNYERQVEALMAGEVDVAWNSPLAWVRSRRIAAAEGDHVEALVMRDTDRNLTSVVVARADSGFQEVEDLAGAVVAVGAIDSPQATLIPLAHLRVVGMEPGRDFRVAHQDSLGGKHGDHGTAERAAARALVSGEVDAACMIAGNHILFAAEGVVPPGSLRVIAETGPFDHCNFTVGRSADRAAMDRFRSILLGMRYEDPAIRPLFELEGLRAWVEGRTEGYDLLEAAVDTFGFYDEKGAITAEGYRY